MPDVFVYLESIGERNKMKRWSCFFWVDFCAMQSRGQRAGVNGQVLYSDAQAISVVTSQISVAEDEELKLRRSLREFYVENQHKPWLGKYSYGDFNELCLRLAAEDLERLRAALNSPDESVKVACLSESFARADFLPSRESSAEKEVIELEKELPKSWVETEYCISLEMKHRQLVDCGSTKKHALAHDTAAVAVACLEGWKNFRFRHLMKDQFLSWLFLSFYYVLFICRCSEIFSSISSCEAGDLVCSGEAISEGMGLSGGELALGKNLVVAYVPFQGYNYEDAIVLSARVVREDLLTSVHIDEIVMEFKPESQDLEMVLCNPRGLEDVSWLRSLDRNQKRL